MSLLYDQPHIISYNIIHAGDVSPHEPLYVQQLAQGTKRLHVLRLSAAQEPEVGGYLMAWKA